MFKRVFTPVGKAAVFMAAGAGGYWWYNQREFIDEVPHGEERYPVQQISAKRGVQIVAPTWSPPSRMDQLNQMRDEEFDVLVIGGGATGSGVAMDCATRGLKVALVEREDFASGTSSRSTKLIHGGIRYLAQAFQSKLPPQSLLDVFKNFRIEKEYLDVVSADLDERAYMIQSAPFMTKPVPMMIPLYRWWEVPMMYVMGSMYDFIAGRRRTVPPSHFIPRSEALYQFPALKQNDVHGNELKGCLVVYDGQQNDTRMNLHIALTAAQNGAVIANHTEVLSLLSSGEQGAEDGEYKITGARIKDTVNNTEFDVRAKQVINACGVFSDSIRRMADPTVADIMVPGPGTHLTLPDYTSPASMGLVWFTTDGRVLYLLPWEGATIAGTTDGPGEVTFEPKPTDQEINFILSECNRVLRDKVTRETVRDPSAAPGDTKALSRDHVVDVTAGGLVTIAGGKWTTYRKMAQDAVDRALEVSPDLRTAATGGCVTSSMKLIGADRGNLVCHQNFNKVAIALRESYEMDKDIADHLCHNYGTRALQLAEMATREPVGRVRAQSSTCDSTFFWKRLSPQHPQLQAEVIFAVRNEYAETAVDVMARRTRLGFLDVKVALQVLPRVLDLMQEELGWSSERREQEEASVIRFLDGMYLPQKNSDKVNAQHAKSTATPLKDRLLY